MANALLKSMSLFAIALLTIGLTAAVQPPTVFGYLAGLAAAVTILLGIRVYETGGHTDGQ